MSWLTRVANVFRSPAVDRALDEEIAFHLEARIDELVAGGMTREVAAATARRQFGNRLHVREQSHDVKSMPELEDLFRDLDHGLRGLRRAPVFASAAILTLALGIGANAAIFSIVGGVLLRPLPYPRPAQLMYLDTQLPALGLPQSMASVAEYLEFQQWNRSFAEVGAFRIGEANLVAGDRAFRVRAAIVDAHLLNALGVPPAEGRLFRSEDGIASAPALPGGSAAAAPVVLISFDLWQAAFGGRPMLGQGLDIDGRRHEVIGVTARGADLMDNHAEIWLPLGFTEEERLSRNNHDLALIGRLKDGVTVAAAQAELNTLIGTWAARAGITPGPDDAGHVFLTAESGGNGHRLRMTPLVDRILGRAGRSIGVLQVAVGLVLLIACANVTNLLIGRAETRRREFAVLTALGASHGRLVRKAMAESLILALAGGSLGVVLARAGVFVLVHAYPASLPRIGGVVVDLQTMLVSLAVAVICGILFGLAPLIPARSDVTADVLKSGTPATTGPARHRLRRGLVVAETALAVVVVVGAGLLLRTVHNLTAVDAGFDRSRLLTFSITLPRASFGLLDRVRVYQGLLDELRAVPGVRGATAMTGLPLDRPYLGNQTEITNNQATSGPSIPIDYQRVMSGHFETMGIPITQGRGFRAQRCRSVRRRSRGRQRGPVENVLEGTKPHRATVASGGDRALVHRDRRGQGRQAECSRSGRGPGGLPARRPARDRLSDDMGRLLADDDARGGENRSARRDPGADPHPGGPQGGQGGARCQAARDGRGLHRLDSASASARTGGDAVRSAGHAACRHRNLRGPGLHGGRASSRDGRPPRPRREPGAAAPAGDGPRAEARGRGHRVGPGRHPRLEPAPGLAALRRPPDGCPDPRHRAAVDDRDRCARLLAAGVACLAPRPEHRASSGVTQ